MRKERIGFVVGVGGAALLLASSPPSDMSLAAWRTAALAWLMASWWVCQTLPLAATALLPLVFLPLAGVASFREAAVSYAHPVVYLLFGGFLIARCAERWGLHRRVAYGFLSLAGGAPRRILLAFMAAAAFMSMWINNTSTAVMLLPVAQAIAALLTRGAEASDSRRFAAALLLGLAYGANVGGIATLIGTAPNALTAAFLAEGGSDVGFLRWSVFAFPVAFSLLFVAWGVLLRILPSRLPLGGAGASEAIGRARRALGGISVAETRVAVVFLALVLAWLLRPFLDDWEVLAGVTDSGFAVFAGVILFLVPSGVGGALLERRDFSYLPWDVLLLFGGGLSLAAAIAQSGLASWLGGAFVFLSDWPLWVLVSAVVALVVFMTELVSNTATMSAMLPVLSDIAARAGVAPLTLLAPAAMAASCAFMLPVATPPNAVVYGSGGVSAALMLRMGIWLNVLVIPVIVLLSLLLVRG